MHGFKHRMHAPIPSMLALIETYLDTGYEGLAADDEEEGDEERAGQRELHGACAGVQAWASAVEKRRRQLICCC